MDSWGSHLGSGLTNPHLHVSFFYFRKALSSFLGSPLSVDISSFHLCEVEVVYWYKITYQYRRPELPIPFHARNCGSPFGRPGFHISLVLLNGASKVCFFVRYVFHLLALLRLLQYEWYRQPADTKSSGLAVYISGIGCQPIHVKNASTHLESCIG
jgi:hypothetical protein